MDTEEINNRINAENDSYKRDLNRKEQDILRLKDRHQRIIADLKRQKEQITKQNIQENISSENIFKSVNEELKKFL